MPGSAACVSRATATTLSPISVTSRLTGSSWNRPTVPKPALFTRRATGRASSITRTSAREIPSPADRSAVRTSTDVPCSASSSLASASSRPVSRATTTRSWPRAASCWANARPMPADAPVTMAMGRDMDGPPGSEPAVSRVAPSDALKPQLGGDGAEVGGDGRTDGDLVDGPLGVLEAVAGHGAHHALAPLDQADGMRPQQAGDRRGGRGLDEDALGRREQPVRGEDLGVAHHVDRAAGLVARRDRAVPARGVADPDRGGERLGVQHGLAQHEGRRALGLPTEHAGPARRAPEILVLGVALPVRGDVAGVADGQAVHVGRVTERLDDLERRGLLALDAEGVDRVHDRHAVDVAECTHDVEGLVEVPADLDDLRAVDERLRELAERDLALGDHDTTGDAGARGVGRGAGRGVAGRRADDDLGALLYGLGDRHRHPAVLEGTGGIRALDLEVD